MREDYLFELELLEYLRKEGFLVAYPIKWKNNLYLIEEKTENGIYFCCLFNYVKGDSIIPLNDKQHYEVGVILAKMHLSLSKFSSNYSRFEWNEYNSIIRPFEQFKNNLGSILSTESEQMTELKNWILTVIHKDLEIKKGIIHGDMHNYNIHFNEHGEFAVFDFDFLGKSYLAFDIACFIGTQRMYASFLETGNDKINVHPFIEGYSSIR